MTESSWAKPPSQPHLLAAAVRRTLQFGAVATLAAAASWAADAPTADSDQQLQEVVVTGSLIARPNAETAQPVTIVTADELKSQGITSVEQALQQIVANQSTTLTANTVTTWGTGGASTASVHGLGGSKTLVLLDGQRLANNVTLGNAVDLNGIPFSAIERIEVLRDGASSLYGSDAIGGVINFITKKNYDKGEIDATYNIPQKQGGRSGDLELTYGKGNLDSDGWNLLVTGDWTKQNQLKAQQRDFASTGYDPARGLANTNGPFGPWPGALLAANGDIYGYGYPGCAGNPHALQAQTGNCEYLYSGAVDLIPEQSVQSGMVQLTKTLPGNNQIQLQYLYTHSTVLTWGGPTEYVEGISPTSPYYPTSGAGFTCALPPCAASAAADIAAGGAEVGWTDPGNNRYQGDSNVEQRLLLKFSGSNNGWTYESDLLWSENHNIVRVSPNSYPDLNELAPGNVISNLINPFGPQSAAGQAFLNSTYKSGELASGMLELTSINGNIQHELGDAFNAGSPAVFALGFDTKWEKISYNPTSLATELYTSSYYPPQAIFGSRNSQAVYTELSVPMAKNLELDVSDRQDRYSDFGNTNNAKIQVRYQPASFLTFRGSASTGFRAPSLVDLYAPQVFGANVTMDGPPCATGAYTTVFSQLNCGSQGMGITGGNPNLKPETSQNFNLGFIIEPIANLGITVDWYRIVLKNEIQEISATTVFDNPTALANLYVLNNAGTLTPANAAATQCPTTSAPTCGYIVTTTQNTGGLATDGFDISTNYLLRTPIGRFNFDFEGNLVTNFNIQAYTNAPVLNLDGWYNQGFEPVIKWSHNFTVDWNLGNWGAGIQNHFTSRYTDEFTNADGSQAYVASYSLWNIYGSWKPIAPLTVTLGIRNLLDTNPSFSNQTANWQAGYNPLFADPLGRTFYARAKYEF
jgi:iron complex outermembrane recepter protein